MEKGSETGALFISFQLQLLNQEGEPHLKIARKESLGRIMICNAKKTKTRINHERETFPQRGLIANKMVLLYIPLFCPIYRCSVGINFHLNVRARLLFQYITGNH